MNKPESEFHPPAAPWTTPPGSAPGVLEQPLAAATDVHHRTVLQRWAPGTDSSALGVARHDCWEEVYILAGSLHDLTLDRTFTAGMYACRPPGMEHGPWVTTDGVTMLVLTYEHEHEHGHEHGGDRTAPSTETPDGDA
ncbi:cupin domain-containing protein [Streptomyces sp. NBC_00344]|uniref:cupin domain-containing protein n=1 Tax=Streptomyces sp. NBC_00344 TaxID=2975720 RepID=UPI002E1E6776